jgi:hypothetical protein
MSRRFFARGGIVVALLVGMLVAVARPAAAAKTWGNMLVLACHDDYYDCRPPCNYMYCC